MNEHTQVAIIGAGVTGLAIARELARAGWAPVAFGSRRATAPRHVEFATSVFRIPHGTVEDVRDAAEASVLWRRLERETQRTLLSRRGSLHIGESVDAARAAMSECGIDYEHVSADATPPGVRPLGAGEHALFQRHGATVDAHAVRHAMEEDARQHGATIHADQHVQAIRSTPDGAKITIGADAITARILVLAAGPSTPALQAYLRDDLGHEAPSRVVLQTSVRLQGDPEQISRIPAVFERRAEDSEFRLAPAVDGGAVIATIASAGTKDQDGVAEPDPTLAREATAWAKDRIESISVQQSAASWLAADVEGERFQLVRSGSVISAVSCAGHGFTFAPLIGARVAALAHERLTS